MNRYPAAKAFLVGSSIPATAITFAYLGTAQHRARHPVKDYEAIPFVVPLVIGSMNAVSVAVQQRYRTSPLKTQLVFGAATGLVMSLVGRYGFSMPKLLFGLKPDKEWIVHLVAPVFYAAIFGAILYPLNKLVINGNQKR